MPVNESNVTLPLLFLPVDQQRALRLKRPQLRRIAEPSPTVNLGRRRRIDNPFLRNVPKSSRAKKCRPFLREQQMRQHGQQRPPLVAMWIVAVLVAQNPRGP